MFNTFNTDSINPPPNHDGFVFFFKHSGSFESEFSLQSLVCQMVSNLGWFSFLDVYNAGAL